MTRRITPVGFDRAQWGVPSGSGFRPFVGDNNGMVSFSKGADFAWTGVGATGAPFNLEIDHASATP